MVGCEQPLALPWSLFGPQWPTQGSIAGEDRLVQLSGSSCISCQQAIHLHELRAEMRRSIFSPFTIPADLVSYRPCFLTISINCYLKQNNSSSNEINSPP
ncbi:hypothetical protein DPMN_018423 [Dreissena polymorpha]|uniref:Uncharacterized protein n=1 Tax=Dreissena polymorpha TaxID=45954 RepID=A0A9D4NH85_DREPO|nr:hypothetical protein DPMN_018423 [Dreissena polymorpha]